MFTSAISPQYIGTTVKANAIAIPRMSLAAYNCSTLAAEAIRAQPIRNGTTEASNVFFLPHLRSIDSNHSFS